MEHKISKLVKVDYDTIQDDETVNDAIAKFAKKSRPRTLLVFNEKNKYIGVVSERMIFRSGSNASETKIKHLAVKAPKMDSEASIFEAAKLMLDSNMKHLPVFDGETILGIVTANDVLAESINATNMGEINVRRFMTATPMVAEYNDKISSIMTLFNESAISRVPIIKEGKPVGIVSKHDIVTKIMIPNNTRNSFNDFEAEKNTLLNNNVESIMNYPLKTLTPVNKTSEAIKLMSEGGINSIVLTDEQGNLRGIVTKKDLLEPLAALVRESEQKRFVQLRGQTSELEPHIKAEIIKDFDDLLKKHESMDEAHAFVYIKKHIGKFHKGKVRGVEIYYLRARLSTNLGTFVASAEEYGVTQAANEVVRLLEKQILTTIDKSRNRTKEEDYFAVKAVA